MYTTVEGQRILGGVLIILKRKGEIVKISEGRKPVMPFVSDATESLIICNIDEQIHKWSSLISFCSSMKDAHIINALNCNVLYFVQ